MVSSGGSALSCRGVSRIGKLPSFAVSLFVGALLTAACGPELTSPASTPQTDRGANVLPTRAASRQISQTIPLAAPALKATLPAGIAKQLPEYVKTVPGVKAAARVGLSNITVVVDGNPSEMSVASVDPDQFRPLAPQSTADEPYVWGALSKSHIFVTHEDHRRIDADPGKNISARGPGGRLLLRVGGVAANGVPNLAGALISTAKAHELGLGDPTLLIVGVDENANIDEVEEELAKLLVGVEFARIGAPTGRAYLTGKDASKALGGFSFTANEDGSITQDSTWVAQHITGKRVPIFTGTMKCHRLMFPQLIGALTEVEAAGLANLIDPKQYGGCYVPRFIGRDINRPLSMHAWGLAIDFNVSDNPQGATPKMDLRIVEIFERWGFRWGGRWTTPDGHHFELAALLKQQTPTNRKG